MGAGGVGGFQLAESVVKQGCLSSEAGSCLAFRPPRGQGSTSGGLGWLCRWSGAVCSGGLFGTPSGVMRWAEDGVLRCDAGDGGAFFRIAAQLVSTGTAS